MRTPFYLKTLQQDLDHWIKAGWVPDDSRHKIIEHAKAQKSGPNIVAVLAILGVVLLGFAVISFVAANWAAMGKLLRMGLILCLMWSAYGIAAYALKRNLMVYAHAFGLLGAVVFGGAIMLIAQSFNIQAHYPTGVLLWFFGAYSTALIIRSNAILVFASLLAGLWMMLAFTGEIADTKQIWLYPILAIGIGIVAGRWKSIISIHVLTISALVFVPNVISVFFETHFLGEPRILALIGCTYIFVALMAIRSPSNIFTNDIVVGWMALAAMGIGFIQQFSFQYFRSDTPITDFPDELKLAGLLLLCITMILAWVWWEKTLNPGLAIGIFVGSILMLFTPVFAMIISLVFAQMLYGAVFFALCVLLLINGIQTGQRSLMLIGGIGFTAQALYIYFETFKDLLGTSLFFLVGGLLLLGLSLLALRLNKQIRGEEKA